jgi:hypothetical protein
VSEPVVVLAWLVVAHLAADFVLQTSRIAADKQGNGGLAWRALLDHALGVGACLVPFVLAFGVPALVLLVVVMLAHVAIDRTKVVLNRGAEAEALSAALERYGTLVGSGGLGTAWTPIPAALFVVDQLAHLLVLGGAWLMLLRDAPLTATWTAVVSAVAGGIAATDVRSIGLDSAVVLALAIVNVRAASLLISTLVSPREVSLGEAPVEPHAKTQVDLPERPAESAMTATAGEGVVVESPAVPSAAGPARIGEAIGVLERLLVVVFVLTGSLAAIGFVVAAKTLARFKQLDDRAFAEYYLLGTLASVSIALGSALAAAAALGIQP